MVGHRCWAEFHDVCFYWLWWELHHDGLPIHAVGWGLLSRTEPVDIFSFQAASMLPAGRVNSPAGARSSCWMSSVITHSLWMQTCSAREVLFQREVLETIWYTALLLVFCPSMSKSMPAELCRIRIVRNTALSEWILLYCFCCWSNNQKQNEPQNTHICVDSALEVVKQRCQSHFLFLKNGGSGGILDHLCNVKCLVFYTQVKKICQKTTRRQMLCSWWTQPQLSGKWTSGVILQQLMISSNGSNCWLTVLLLVSAVWWVPVIECNYTTDWVEAGRRSWWLSKVLTLYSSMVPKIILCSHLHYGVC